MKVVAVGGTVVFLDLVTDPNDRARKQQVEVSRVELFNLNDQSHEVVQHYVKAAQEEAARLDAEFNGKKTPGAVINGGISWGGAEAFAEYLKKHTNLRYRGNGEYEIDLDDKKEDN